MYKKVRNAYSKEGVASPSDRGGNSGAAPKSPINPSPNLWTSAIEIEGTNVLVANSEILWRLAAVTSSHLSGQQCPGCRTMELLTFEHQTQHHGGTNFNDFQRINDTTTTSTTLMFLKQRHHPFQVSTLTLFLPTYPSPPLHSHTPGTSPNLPGENALVGVSA